MRLTEPGGESGKSFGLIGKATEKGVEAGYDFAFSTPLEDSAGKGRGRTQRNLHRHPALPGQNLTGTCSGTATVPGGGFAERRRKNIRNSVSGAIVGGAGKYSGAVGTFSSKAIESGPNSPKN